MRELDLCRPVDELKARAEKNVVAQYAANGVNAYRLAEKGQIDLESEIERERLRLARIASGGRSFTVFRQGLLYRRDVPLVDLPNVGMDDFGIQKSNHGYGLFFFYYDERGNAGRRAVYEERTLDRLADTIDRATNVAGHVFFILPDARPEEKQIVDLVAEREALHSRYQGRAWRRPEFRRVEAELIAFQKVREARFAVPHKKPAAAPTMPQGEGIASAAIEAADTMAERLGGIALGLLHRVLGRLGVSELEGVSHEQV